MHILQRYLNIHRRIHGLVPAPVWARAPLPAPAILYRCCVYSICFSGIEYVYIFDYILICFPIFLYS